MATRFRALAAPINVSTGDGRRFATGSITATQLPIPVRWVREQDGEHDGAVIVGSIDKVDITDTEVWVEGRFFDDVDRERMPRLAEDVAELLHLIQEGVSGPSVDLEMDDMDAVPVRVGTDEPVDLDTVTEDDKLELLITAARIRAATIVALPAFTETEHNIELLQDVEEPAEATDEADLDALIASLGSVEVDRFLPPVKITGPTPITYDFDAGIAYGHIYQSGTCHVGILDRCATPPEGDTFSLFHRYPVQTPDGVVKAGRLTVGGLHADRSADFSQVIRAHDGKKVAAYVRAWEDDYGIMVCGPIASDLDEDTREVLARRKVSGHWPEMGETLALAELLALPPGDRVYSEPGFPVGVHVRDGRVVGMTASLGPSASKIAAKIDLASLGREIVTAMRADEEERRQAAELRAKLSADLTSELREQLMEAADVQLH